MWREHMRRMQIAPRLADTCAWALIAGAAIVVAARCAEEGPAVIGRIAAWLSAPDLSRPSRPAELGPRNQVNFRYIPRAGEGSSSPCPAGPP
jgi:hypothetical protein